MAEKYEPDEWEAVVCNGLTAVNVLSSNNVEELGWDFTEMELDPTGTCGLFEGMLLDWDDDTPEERREHEEYFPDAFTRGNRRSAGSEGLISPGSDTAGERNIPIHFPSMPSASITSQASGTPS